MATGMDVLGAGILVGGVCYGGYRMAKWCSQISPPFLGAIVAFLGTQGASSLFVAFFAALFLPVVQNQSSGQGEWLGYLAAPTSFLVGVFAAIYAAVENRSAAVASPDPADRNSQPEADDRPEAR